MKEFNYILDNPGDRELLNHMSTVYPFPTVVYLADFALGKSLSRLLNHFPNIIHS